MRVRFSREGATSYLAHLDMMRMFERSLRRSGVPLAFTQGFNPHPVMTFALPLGVGVDTEADFADFSLTAEIDPDTFKTRLNEALPEGIRVLEARLAPEGGDSLMASVHAAIYRLRSPGLAAAAARLPVEGPLPVGKKGKEGVRIIDVRPLLLGVEAQDDDTVRLLAKAGSRENLRPDLFLQALADHAGLPQESADDAEIRRLVLFTIGPDGGLAGLT
jgi:radical SAM-linked protein